MTPYVPSLIALAVLFSTASKLLHRYVLKETEPYAYALLNNIIGALFFFPLALKNFSLPTEEAAWIALTFSIVLWTTFAVVKFISYKRTEVSIVDPLGQSKLLWALIFGILVLGETPSVLRAVGTLVVFLGASILLFHPEQRFGRLTDSGVRWTLVAALLTAGGAVIDKFSLQYFTLEVYGFLAYAGPTFLLLMFLPGRTTQLVHLFRRRPWTATSALVIDTTSYFFILKTFAAADLTLVYPFLQIGTLLTAIGGIVIFREREHLLQKLIATVIIVTGSVLVRF